MRGAMFALKMCFPAFLPFGFRSDVALGNNFFLFFSFLDLVSALTRIKNKKKTKNNPN